MSEAPIAPTPTPDAAAPPTPAIPGGSPLGVQPPAPEGEVKPPEGEAKPPEGEAKPPEAKAPEKYEFKLPEGIEAAPEAVSKFEEVARTHNLSQEAAQGLMDMHFEQLKTQAETLATAQTQAWTTTIDTWKGEMAKTYQGEALTKAQTDIGRALDEYGSPEVRQAFDLTGAGWNPAIFSFVHKMAQALSEGTIQPGGGAPTAKGSTLGTRLYGSE